MSIDEETRPIGTRPRIGTVSTSIFRCRSTASTTHGAPAPTVEEYISHYEKKIEGDVPAVTVEHFHRVMGRPRDSSTGPDGIPFSVYRHLHETAAPLLFKYYEYMSSRGHCNRSFNHTNLFFFPKDGISNSGTFNSDEYRS